MTPLSIRQSWIWLKVASGRGSARSTPLITAPTCGVSFSTLMVAGAMAGLLWLAAISWRTPAFSSSSRCRVAAVHRQRHACHELRLVAGEIEDGRRHIGGLAEAAQRMTLLQKLMPGRIAEKRRGHPSSAWPNGLWPEGNAPSTRFDPANRVDSTPDRALRDSRGLARRCAARRGRQGPRWR